MTAEQIINKWIAAGDPNLGDSVELNISEAAINDMLLEGIVDRLLKVAKKVDLKGTARKSELGDDEYIADLPSKKKADVFVKLAKKIGKLKLQTPEQIGSKWRVFIKAA